MSGETGEIARRVARRIKHAAGSITEAQTLDHVGITDVICLMGFYTSVSMTLAFYDVPAGAEAWSAERPSLRAGRKYDSTPKSSRLIGHNTMKIK